MAHFARIEDGIVREVLVINNEVILDENGIESEELGAAFCADHFGGEWIQTSFNSSIRGKFAGLGDIWDGTEFKVAE